ncbi:MAG: pyridoxal-phosphate dependent enzyme [Desulfurococcales archaeon]|nr:pyridoxal-phosphate dependent enzyme [Desulfurococcales archaeon]
MNSILKHRLEKLRLQVGNTPIKCYTIDKVDVCVKLEYTNPSGSHKDRIVLGMLENLVDKGEVKENGCISEVSSGNTALAVAWAAKYLGLNARIYTTPAAPKTKKQLIEALGATLIEAPRGADRDELIAEAKAKGCTSLRQDDNEYNILIHYTATGQEMLYQLNGVLDAFFMGIGTGGTIVGVGSRLKQFSNEIKIVGITPRNSALAGGKGGDVIPGLASKEVPPLITQSRGIVDALLAVSNEEAWEHSWKLYQKTGLLTGLSTGASYAAIEKALEQGLISEGSRIAIIAADRLYPYIIG